MTIKLRGRSRATILLVSALASVSMLATAVAPAEGSLATESSASAALRTKPKVIKTLTLAPVSAPNPLLTGTSLAFTGTAPKALRGKGVSLLRQVDAKKWVTVSTARISKTGTFNLNGIVTGGGTNTWKAKAQVNRGRKKAPHVFVSPARKMVVYSWRYLSDMPPVGGSTDSSGGSGKYVGEDMYAGRATIGGTSFNKSLYNATSWDFDEPTWVEYNVAYKCLRFETSIGVDDSSESGYSVEFLTTIDGVETSVGKAGIGAAQVGTSLDLTSRMRIRLDQVRLHKTHPDNGGPEGYGVWANPRVLCSDASR